MWLECCGRWYGRKRETDDVVFRILWRGGSHSSFRLHNNKNFIAHRMMLMCMMSLEMSCGKCHSECAANETEVKQDLHRQLTMLY